jgi:hypothetical protein
MYPSISLLRLTFKVGFFHSLSCISICIITAPVVLTACLRVWCTEYAFTRSVHQLPAYASGTLLKHWLRGEVR